MCSRAMWDASEPRDLTVGWVERKVSKIKANSIRNIHLRKNIPEFLAILAVCCGMFSCKRLRNITQIYLMLREMYCFHIIIEIKYFIKYFYRFQELESLQ
jgi:hypothetical protein